MKNSSNEFFDLPDELISEIVSYLDTFTIIKRCIRISEQFKRICTNSERQFIQHLNLSRNCFSIKSYHGIHKCSLLKHVISLDLRFCSIGVEDFIDLIKSGNLCELKSLIVSNEELALEIAKMYNECIEILKSRISSSGKEGNVDLRDSTELYTLPKLEFIGVEEVCKLNLVSPVKHCNEIKSFNPWKLNLPERFGDLSDVEQSLKEMIVLPSKFPQLFASKRFPRRFLLFGPNGCGKSMIFNQLHQSLSSNTIEPLLHQYCVEDKLLQKLFKISTSFGKYVPSFLRFDNNLNLPESEGEPNRRFLVSILLELDGYDKKSNLSIFLHSESPSDLHSAIRRRFEKRFYIRIPKGYQLIPHVKFQLEKRFESSSSLFSNHQIEEIAKLFNVGYSPQEIETIFNSLKFSKANYLPSYSELLQSLRHAMVNSKPYNTVADIEKMDQFFSDYC